MDDRRIAHLALGSTGIAARAALEFEQAAARMAAVCPAHALLAAFAESKRRQDIGISPTDAHLSVADDLIRGRWRP